ncbi:MAG: arylesterase [Akkermansiaceae bacterium]|nr:arylesterase [Akkermansiaceae bacterium]
MRNGLPTKGVRVTTRYGRGGGLVNAIWLILSIFLAGINGIAAADAKPARILAIGTSLTQGYNLPPGRDFTAVLQAQLKAKGHDVTVVNAGVSGDTSAGGLARLDWALGEDFDGVIVELGSNDALRGLGVEQTRTNLDQVLTKLKTRKVAVLFTGMKSPRNLGPEYVAAFDAVYPELAKKHGVLFYPFFLEGVAANLKLNQADGIHPNEEGTKVIVRGMLPYVEKLLAKIDAVAEAGSIVSPSKHGAASHDHSRFCQP